MTELSVRMMELLTQVEAASRADGKSVEKRDGDINVLGGTEILQSLATEPYDEEKLAEELLRDAYQD